MSRETQELIIIDKGNNKIDWTNLEVLKEQVQRFICSIRSQANKNAKSLCTKHQQFR